jgi:hypothetical protein
MISKERALYDMKVLVSKLEKISGYDDEIEELLELIDFVGEQLGAVIPDPDDIGMMANNE